MFYYHIFGCKNNKKITFSDIQLEKKSHFQTSPSFGKRSAP